jgi:hypothetical protein
MTFGYRKQSVGSDCIHWDLSGDLGVLAEKGVPLSLLLIVIWVGVLYDRQAYRKYQFYAARKLNNRLLSKKCVPLFI